MNRLITSDPTMVKLIEKERKRQSYQLQMIPSENYASASVREAVGSILMNKYSEGQVGKRYYQGNAVIDEVERLCKERALAAFKLNPDHWSVNVQALSGSPANLAVYNALLQPGDKIMSMYLPDGGHLSHGWHIDDNKVSFISKIWRINFYHVDKKTLVFNYDEVEKQAMREKPKLIIAGGTAYPREINHKRMGQIARKAGCYYMADVAHEAGLIAGGANTSPFLYADIVTMTTHKTLRGPRGALIFSKKELAPLINKSVFPGLQGGPHNHTIAGIGVALFEALKPSFKKYTKQIVSNAKMLAHELGNYGFTIVSGGTDKHLVLVDLRNKSVIGKVAAVALEQANIVCNANTIPFDTASPLYPSGLRLGTPAITTRGMKEREMKKIAGWINEVVNECQKFQTPDTKEALKAFIADTAKKLQKNKKIIQVGKEVQALTKKFPVPF